MREESAGVSEKRLCTGVHMGCDCFVIGVGGLVTQRAVLEPCLDVIDVSAFGSSAQQIVVRQLVHGIAVAHLQNALDEFQREFMGILEALDDAVAHDFIAWFGLCRSDSLLQLRECEAQGRQIERLHGSILPYIRSSIQLLYQSTCISTR